MIGLIGEGPGTGAVAIDYCARFMTSSTGERAVCVFKFKATKPSVASVRAKAPPPSRICFILMIIINKSLIRRHLFSDSTN